MILSNQTSYYFTLRHVIYDSVTLFVFIYMLAIPVWLLTQGPALALERLVLARYSEKEEIYKK